MYDENLKMSKIFIPLTSTKFKSNDVTLSHFSMPYNVHTILKTRVGVFERFLVKGHMSEALKLT